jgi:hypothetical protein
MGDPAFFGAIADRFGNVSNLNRMVRDQAGFFGPRLIVSPTAPRLGWRDPHQLRMLFLR